MMTTIKIKPKGQDGPIIEGENSGPYSDAWNLRLAPGVPRNTFPKDNWEEVPTPFEFPTKRNALIEYKGPFGTLYEYVRDNDMPGQWRNARNGATCTTADFRDAVGKWRVIFEGE